MPRPALRDYIPHSLLVASACLALAGNVYLLFPREGTRFIPIFAGIVTISVFACEVGVTSTKPWPEDTLTDGLSCATVAATLVLGFARLVTIGRTLETQRNGFHTALILSLCAGALGYIFGTNEWVRKAEKDGSDEQLTAAEEGAAK
ncbi:hypothetical protein JCM10207_008336 [Rhodosporidiobolus poonsookiae]